MFRIIDGDNILYETNLGVTQSEMNITYHMIMHSALDFVQKQENLTQNMYLGKWVESGELGCYAYITASSVRFLIFINEKVTEDTIKQFFTDVYKIYVQVKLLYNSYKQNMMNPLYKVGTKITSQQFD